MGGMLGDVLLDEIISFLGLSGACKFAMANRSLWDGFQSYRKRLVMRGLDIDTKDHSLSELYIISFITRFRTACEQMTKPQQMLDLETLDMIASSMPDSARIAIREFIPSISMDDSLLFSKPSRHVITGMRL
jgi:hypothetical protein